MSKVTSKYQVTLPRSLARKERMNPGTEIGFEAVGGGVRIHRVEGEAEKHGTARLLLFDRATERQRAREAEHLLPGGGDRGWKREDFYVRGTS